MESLSSGYIQNRFLRALPERLRTRLIGCAQNISLEQGQQIDRTDRTLHHIHFVERGYIASVRAMADGRIVKIGGVGIEGFTAPIALLGFRKYAMLDGVVHMPGKAWRIERAFLKPMMEKEPILQRMVEQYARFMVDQLAQTAACNALHSMEQRVCRSLLTASDNALSSQFPLTQEYLATLLGVHRPGLSLAAGALKKAGIIDYSWGSMRILNRGALLAATCECYQVNRDGIEGLYAGAGGATDI